MTQKEKARAGVITPEMEVVAEKEQIDALWLRDRVGEGRIVIPANPNHLGLSPCGVGEGLSIKVNANIGTSSDRADLDEELQKLNAALEAGADAVMDLSTGGDINRCRKQVIEASPVPVGTVPIYQAVVETLEEKGGLIHLTVDKIFDPGAPDDKEVEIDETVIDKAWNTPDATGESAAVLVKIPGCPLE